MMTASYDLDLDLDLDPDPDMDIDRSIAMHRLTWVLERIRYECRGRKTFGWRSVGLDDGHAVELCADRRLLRDALALDQVAVY